MSVNSFGRLIAPSDAHDLNYSMRAAMPQIRAAKAPTPRKRAYNDAPVLDQGNTPQCVGYSARGFLEGAPIMTRPGEGMSATALYHGAQDHDEWPGRNYDGSSIRGVMKFMQKAGLISSYVWGQTIEDAIRWMNGGYGTILLGTYWYANMTHVDRNGFMLEPPRSSSTPIGGHAYRAIWYDAKKGGILIRNSWGNDWGYVDKKGIPTGYAYMTIEFAKWLLRQDGEIAAPTQTKIIATPL